MDLLDHGSLNLIEAWGSDERIIEAARMSTAKGFRWWGDIICPQCAGKPVIALHTGEPTTCSECKGKGVLHGDEKLLKYLWKHQHTTPFEVAGATVAVCCPVVVVWQWVRHRTMTYNILSGRYAEMPNDDYLPTVERCLMVDDKNKQAGAADGSESLTAESATAWLAELSEAYAHLERVYQSGLRRGVPKELARLPVGFARYTRMRVSANLLNWLKFLKLRCAADAQHEIRVYADAVRTVLAEKFPRTLALFNIA